MKFREKKGKFIFTLEYGRDAKAMIEEAAFRAGITPAAFIMIGHRMLMDLLADNPDKARSFAEAMSGEIAYRSLPLSEKN